MASTTAGNSHIISNLDLGADAAGVDLKVFGDTTGYYLLWDASANKLISLGGIDIGVNDAGHDVIFYGGTSGSLMQWDEGADRLEFVGAGIDIGACTTGIAFVGDMTTGISMPAALTATDAILIAGANADAIHISGANTVAALHISGDQAIGILYDVDGSATDGLKFDIDTSMVLTRGIYFTGAGTATTAISIDVDGTTAINVGSTFTGVDMIVLNGTASGYGIEISGACTLADIILQGGGTIDDAGTATGGSGDVLAITQDMIQLTGQVEIGKAWGTDGDGAIVIASGSGWDWAFQANAVIEADVTGTAVAGAYTSLAVAVTQTQSTSVFGSWTDLVFSNGVNFSAADNAAAIWAQLEAGTSFQAPATAGDFAAGIYTNVKMGTTFTTAADAVVNGVRVQSEVASGSASHAGRLAAFECLTRSGLYLDWDYGLYVAGSTTGIYIDPATCTAGIQIGAAATATGSGMAPASSAPCGFYFDDQDSAISTYSECFNVGYLQTAASTSATAGLSALHVYVDQRANFTGGVDVGMSALWASYLIRNSSTADGCDNEGFSALNLSVDVEAGSTLQTGSTLACVAFGGNWPGTVSGKIFPMMVRNENYAFSGFAKIDCDGCYQDAAAGANEKHLKVYLGDTLYTITMLTA